MFLANAVMGPYCRYPQIPARINWHAPARRVSTKEPRTMSVGDSAEEQFPECDFDPEKLSLRVSVTLAADRKAVDQVVEQVMEAIRDTKCVNGKADAIDEDLCPRYIEDVVTHRAS